MLQIGQRCLPNNTNDSDCVGYEIEEGNYRIKGYEGPSLECDKCGSEMQLKTGRFGEIQAKTPQTEDRDSCCLIQTAQMLGKRS